MAITQEQANQIIQAYQSGVDPQTLAAQYGLTQSDVNTYFPGFDTTGLNLPSGAPAPIDTSFNQPLLIPKAPAPINTSFTQQSGSKLPSKAPAPISTSFTQQSGSRLTPGQAQQLYNAYQQGDMTQLQNLVNQYGVTSSDVQAYFPGFDMANAPNVSLEIGRAHV